MEPKIGKDGRYHIVYRTHNLINGKEYTGKHSTDDLNDGYYGSGSNLKHAIIKYGLENFAVEILSFHDSEEAALAEEARIVDEEYVEREDTYNIATGGQGGYTGNYCYGFGKFKDINGNVIHTAINDPRIRCGDLTGIAKDTLVVVDENGKKFRVSTSDNRYLNGELKHHNYGRTMKMNNIINIACPHCNKIGRPNNMKRWHFDNCKRII